MDFSSTAAFLAMLDETIETMADRDMAPALQFLRFVGSRVDETTSTQKELLHLMRTIIGHSIVRPPPKLSAEIANAATRYMAVYELTWQITTSAHRIHDLTHLNRA